jgi:hypothetical protein
LHKEQFPLDPQATWLAMIQALVDDDRAAASEHANSLYDWLDRGGFSPKVLPDLGQTEDPKSSVYRLDRMIAFYVCAIVRTDS